MYAPWNLAFGPLPINGVPHPESREAPRLLATASTGIAHPDRAAPGHDLLLR